MPETPPVVYILHGDDEYAITQFLTSLVEKLGDPVFAELNTTRLDGRTASLEEIETAVYTLPFMVKRRLVILTNPLARLNAQTARQKFTDLLDRVPAAVAFVLVENQPLVDEQGRKKNRTHWLEDWAEQAKHRPYIRLFLVPQGPALTRRLQEQARAAGGQITAPAAELLASLVGDSPLSANQEIHKLLAYANYNRPIEVEDVEHLTADQSHGDIFTMVDAIGNQDGKQALNMLHHLLNEQDTLSIFSMVVRQFRLLLLAREVLDAGGSAHDAVRSLKVHPYVAEKAYAQARKFTMPVIVDIYHYLLDLDLKMKTGEIEGEVALDTFISAITGQSS